MNHALLPCKTCPWRVDQDASVIQHYRHDKACGLMDTVGPEDAFRKIMACHGSPVGQERACNGYLAREGWRNLNVRLHVALGNMESPDAVLEECEVYGIELHRDYPEVLERYYSMTMGDYDRQRIELERLYGSELAAKVLENELCRQKEQNRKKRRRP